MVFHGFSKRRARRAHCTAIGADDMARPIIKRNRRTWALVGTVREGEVFIPGPERDGAPGFRATPETFRERQVSSSPATIKAKLSHSLIIL
jgi:hypothetical protein